jgi:uncharacterized protein YjbI with pentapeptide repeats
LARVLVFYSNIVHGSNAKVTGFLMSSEITSNISIELIIGLISLTLALLKLIDYGRDKLKSERETYYETIHKLSSLDNVDQISAAIALRAYIASRWRLFNRKLADEAIHVILAILKISPTGMLQKTLADSLSQAKSLNKRDFQRANLSNIYLGTSNDLSKKLESIPLISRIPAYEKITKYLDVIYTYMTRKQIKDADFYECYAYNGSFKGAKLDGSHFNNAIFVNFVFTDCSLVKCDFTGADLSNSKFIRADLEGCKFDGAIINGCKFDGAKNIELASFENIVGDVLMVERKPSSSSRKLVFVSKPTTTTHEQQGFFERLKSKAEKDGIDFITIERDNYRDNGVLENIRQKIVKSDLVIVLGFIQVVADKAVVKQQHVDNLCLPTSWNQIESGIAIGANKKVIFVKQKEINDGIFCGNLGGVVDVEEISLEDQYEVNRIVMRLNKELKGA